MFFNTRLYDVFISGPIYIYFSMFIQNKILALFVLLVGISTILYNLHNYLLIESKTLKTSLLPFGLTDAIKGKTQLHRLYNLLLMYPLLIYANYTTKSPIILRSVLWLMIVGGFIFNLFHFIRITKFV